MTRTTGEHRHHHWYRQLSHHHGRCRNPVHCFLPPDILEQMAQS